MNKPIMRVYQLVCVLVALALFAVMARVAYAGDAVPYIIGFLSSIVYGWLFTWAGRKHREVSKND